MILGIPAPNRIRTWPALLVLWLCALPSAGLFAQDLSNDAKFLTGLRDRHLYRLAEAYCLDRLADTELDQEARADLVIQLSETYVQHARHTPPEEADTYWAQAFDVPQNFDRDYPNSPWKLPVKFQAAMVLLSRGELLRERAELLGNNARMLNEARGYLRMTIEQLKVQAAEVQQEVQASERISKPDGPARWQWPSLQKQLEFELARAFRNQGLAYPDRSADRDNALRQALELLDPLARMATVDPLAWKARIAQISCLREMHDLAGTQRKLEQLQKENPPQAVSQLAMAEVLRLLLSAGQVDQAVQALAKVPRGPGGQMEASLEFAMLEVALAKWQKALAAEATNEAKTWQQNAATLVNNLEQRHGTYWARRAESLLASVSSSEAVPGDGNLVNRAAEAAYRAGEIDKAVQLFLQASNSALGQGRRDDAFRLAYLAGQIDYERKRWDVAAEQLQQASLIAPQLPQAAEAHLLAIYAAAQLARVDADGLAAYRKLIDEHLDKWPEDPSANTVWYYRGQSEEFAKNWMTAIDAYRHVQSDAAKFEEAVRGIGRCYHALLAADAAAGKDTDNLARQAASYFELLVFGERNSWPEKWSSPELEATLRAVDFRLRYASSGAPRCESILRTALQKAVNAPQSWQSAAQVLLATALVKQEKFADAEQILRDVSQGSPQQLFILLQGLNELTESASEPQTRAQLGRLQLQAARLLEPRLKELTAPQQRVVAVVTNQALASSGQLAEAIQRTQKLVEQNPRDPDALESLASLLSQSNKTADQEAALLRWRELERHSRPGTARWYRAKYYLAETHARLGNQERAAQIVNVTKILHPDLGGPEWKPKFEALLQGKSAATPK